MISLVLVFSLTGCKSKSNDYSSLENLLKKELIRQKYLEEKNFSNLRIENTLEHGYYKNSPEKKYVQINLKYKCKDKTDSCIHNILTKQDDYYTLFVYTDEKRIYQLSKGISIDYKDIDNGDYIQFKKGYEK